MDAKARRARDVIRDCVFDGRYLVLPHFRQRLAERGLVWPDVMAVIDEPTAVRGDGRDAWDRPRWIVHGTAADGLPVEIVCVLDTDDLGRLTVFVTLYER
ncbi:MAG: DUF4258 domain-containing protein [Phycisphaerales bacterium]|nr:DUF4258 domain-containing protein [Phycisphaerales bacterium]